MGSEKGIFLSILLFAFTLVVVSRAADPECDRYPPGITAAFPHEYNCSLYYECRNGNKYLMQCPGGLYFSPDTASCDFPSISGCVNGVNQCDTVDVDYFPIPGVCTEYIECYYGDSYLMSCPTGLFFDSILKRCVIPEESNCRMYTTPPWTTPVLPYCYNVHAGDEEVRPIPGDCQHYVECFGSYAEIRSCPYGMLFDRERKMCDFPNVVDCDDTTATANPSTPPTVGPVTPGHDDPRCYSIGGITYWSDPIDCRKYIECYNGASYEMDCPNGLYFSEQLRECVLPSQSECGRTNPPTRGPTSEKPTGWTRDPRCDLDGKLYPYPGDCRFYYECAEGRLVRMPCPPDLWFFFARQRCDYPYLSDCTWWNLSDQIDELEIE